LRVPAQHDLYEAEGAEPSLIASRCSSCGRVAFPAMTIGCDVCGGHSELLERMTISASGVLYSVATVHSHQGDRAAPFTIGEILLDAGPLIRAEVVSGQADLAIEERVEARWQVIRVDEQGHDVVEPVFSRVCP
jgi:uncharacterized protein